MIKIALKHFIYETCISIFFNAVSRNFCKPIKFTVNMFRKGDKYKYIKIYVDDTLSITYIFCNVNKVFNNSNNNNFIEIKHKRYIVYNSIINKTDIHKCSQKLQAYILCNSIIEAVK